MKASLKVWLSSLSGHTTRLPTSVAKTFTFLENGEAPFVISFIASMPKFSSKIILAKPYFRKDGYRIIGV